MKNQKIAFIECPPNEQSTVVLNSINFRYLANKKLSLEKGDKTSQTVPDQNMSIRQILKRYSMGLAPEMLPGEYEFEAGETPDDNEWDLPTVAQYRNLDIADKQALREQVTEELFDIQRRKAERDMQKNANMTKTPPLADLNPPLPVTPLQNTPS